MRGYLLSTCERAEPAPQLTWSYYISSKTPSISVLEVWGDICLVFDVSVIWRVRTCNCRISKVKYGGYP